jgi:hypothetical protein
MGGDHQPGRSQRLIPGAQPERAFTPGDFVNTGMEAQFEPRAQVPAVGDQHVAEVLRAPVAEDLSAGLFVEGNALRRYEGHDFVRGEAGQRGGAKRWIGRQVIIRPGIDVGEIAPPAAGHQDLPPRLRGMVRQHDAPAPARGLPRAEKPGRPGPEDDGVHVFHAGHYPIPGTASGGAT